MTIMCIDDDAEDREFFCEAVRNIDPLLMCYLCKDGVDGLRNLREMIVMPDYIFVDVNMPIMNGRQFLQEVKNLPRLRSIPVIMYSTTAHADEIQEYLKLGAYKVLVKPNTLTKIESMIKAVLHDQLAHSDRILGEVRK